MNFHTMRTTLVLDDRVMKRLKALAAQRGQTLSSLVDALLRQGLDRERTERAKGLPPLPSFRAGKVKANVADRDELYRVMERSG